MNNLLGLAQDLSDFEERKNTGEMAANPDRRDENSAKKKRYILKYFFVLFAFRDSFMLQIYL